MRLTAKGIAQKDAELKAMIDRVKSLKPVMTVASEVDIKGLIYDSFIKSQTPYGKAWQQLAPKTLERRRKGSSKILVNKGLDAGLWGSVTTKPTDKTVVFGTNMPYAATHQFGDKGRNIPQRQFMPSDGFESGPAAKIKDRILRRIRDYILRGKVK